jgi:hypothetical protein
MSFNHQPVPNTNQPTLARLMATLEPIVQGGDRTELSDYKESVNAQPESLQKTQDTYGSWFPPVYIWCTDILPRQDVARQQSLTKDEELEDEGESTDDPDL